ncbi:WYL domain-containing protein [Thiomicrorhabdus hydrogeniphila]
MNKEKRQRFLIEKISQIHQSIQIIELANDYECSEKTLRRDLQFLIEERNAPWFIHNGRLHKDPSKTHSVEIHGYWFNKQEIESLFALNQIIEQLSPGGLKKQLHPLQNKLQQLLKTEVTGKNLTQFVKLIEISDSKLSETVFQTITQALAEQKQLKMTYWIRERDEYSERTISPQQLVRYRDNWKLDAWCHSKNSLRTFALEAIKDLKILEKTIQIISKETLKDHFESSYGIYAGKADKQAILKFSPYIARWVKDEMWHPQQISQYHKDGSYQLQIPYNKDEELIQDILQYGAEIEVLAPKELREKLKEKLQKTLEKYTND